MELTEWGLWALEDRAGLWSIAGSWAPTLPALARFESSGGHRTGTFGSLENGVLIKLCPSLPDGSCCATRCGEFVVWTSTSEKCREIRSRMSSPRASHSDDRYLLFPLFIISSSMHEDRFTLFSLLFKGPEAICIRYRTVDRSEEDRIARPYCASLIISIRSVLDRSYSKGGWVSVRCLAVRERECARWRERDRSIDRVCSETKGNFALKMITCWFTYFFQCYFSQYIG